MMDGTDTVMSHFEFMELAATTEPDEIANAGFNAGFGAGVMFGKFIEHLHRMQMTQFQMRTGIKFPQSKSIETWYDAATKLMAMFEERGLDCVTLWRDMSDGETKWAYQDEEAVLDDHYRVVEQAWKAPHVDTPCLFKRGRKK